MVKHIVCDEECACSPTRLAKGQSKILRLLVFSVGSFLAFMLVNASFEAQASWPQSPAAKVLSTSSETSLPNVSTASETETADAKTDEKRKSGDPQNRAQQTESEPTVQPNAIDPFSIGRIPMRTHPGPLSTKEKFEYFEKPVFGRRALAMTAVGTGIFMTHPLGSYPHDWRDGAGAFGRNYADRLVRNEASAFGRFSFDSLRHIDPRYSRSSSSSFFSRSSHALGFTLVGKTDSGRRTLAFGNLAGAVASGFVGNGYLPSGWNDPTHAGQRTLATFGGYAALNLAQEFAPEIVRGLRRLHAPKLPLPPVWWTR